MSAATYPRPRREPSGGFTLTEMMVAVSIGGVVMVGLATLFIWSLRTAQECRQYAWAQTEATQSSQRLVSYVRNCVVVTNIDAAGNWVDLVMPQTGVVARLTYINPDATVGNGRLLLIENVLAPGSPTNVVAEGLTKVMSMPVRNIFEQTSPNTLRIAYRITKPLSSGQYPAEVDFGVKLRNHGG